MLDRRQFIAGVAVAAAGTGLARPALAQARVALDVYTDSDTNIQDFWRNLLKPAFEKAEPGFTVNLTVVKGVAAQNRTIAERAYAALQAKQDPKVDFLEQFDTRLPAGALEAGLWTEVTPANVPNSAKINKLAADIPTRFAYRGSQVLLAYDSDKVKQPPKTFAELVAWAKKNPGKFTYGRPDKGGSGQNMVIRAIHEANGRDPSLFKVNNYTPALADERYAKAWELLRDLHPHTYGQGSYPAGNTPALQLLAQGVVDMIPAWSDQALQALAQGVLPKSVKLVQLTDLALCGGFTYAAIPSNAKNHAGSLKLANFLLTPQVQELVVREIGGFPGLDWGALDPKLREEFADVIPSSIPTFPDGDWKTALNAGWYKNVATNIAQ